MSKHSRSSLCEEILIEEIVSMRLDAGEKDVKVPMEERNKRHGMIDEGSPMVHACVHQCGLWVMCIGIHALYGTCHAA